MKQHKFVHCPKPGCDKPLRGAWKDYLTGEVHPKTGLPVYQCPHCHMKFTADSFKVNSIPVTDDSKDVVLYDAIAKRVIDIIPARMKFTDGRFHYVHIPISLCTQENIKCFSFETKGLKMTEVEDLCEQAINSKVEVLR